MALLPAASAFAEAGFIKGSATSTGYTLPKSPGKDAVSAIYRKNGNEESVLIAILGLCRSYIFMNGEPMYVYTSDL